MWGVVQTAVSELDFDFDGYANEHFDASAPDGRPPALRFLAARGAWLAGVSCPHPPAA